MVNTIITTGSALLTSLLQLWYGAINAIPGVIGALIILILGYIIAWAISYVFEHVLERAQLDKWLVHKTHVGKIAGGFRLAHLIGTLTRWSIFIIFLPSAAYMLGGAIEPLAEFLRIVALWVPKAIGAILIAFFGTIAAEYVYWKIMALESSKSHIISDSAKAVIYVLTGLIVLGQLGINVSLASGAFLIILSGVMLGIALAIGIGFGLGMKDDARAIIKDMRRKL